MMVDSGIVVLDSVREKLDERINDFSSATRAIIEGVEQVKNPVIASVASSLVVFLPVLFLSGIPGAVFGDMALTISFSNTGTLIASLALIPMLSELRVRGFFSRFVYSSKMPKFTDAFCTISDTFFEELGGKYIRALDFSLSNGRIAIFASLALVLLGILFSFCLDRELMPGVNSDRFTIAITTPPGTPLEESASVARLIEGRIQAINPAGALFTRVGSEPKEAVFERLSGMQPNQAAITVLPGDRRGSSARDLLSAIKKNLSVPEGVDVDFRIKKDSISALLSGQQKPLVIELYGRDLSALKSRGDDLKRRLVSVSGLSRVSSTLDAATPECRIDLDRTAMSSLTIAAASAASALRGAIRGGRLHLSRW
jgi:HAE1 family hydrophobic/amphiphilic exporter-1